MFKISILLVLIGLIYNPSLLIAKTDAKLEAALTSFNNRDYQKSKKQFIELLKADKRNGVYWFNLGHVYSKLNSPEAALKCYERVITLNSPLAPAAKYYRAKLLFENGQQEKAKTVLHDLLSNDRVPQNLKFKARALLKRTSSMPTLEEQAFSAYQSGDYSRAERILKSIPKEKQSEDTQLLLLLVYSQTDNRREFQKIKRSYFRMPTVSQSKRTTVLELEKNFSTSSSQISLPIIIFADFSIGNNDNVYADGESADPLSSIETRLFAGGSYQWGIGHNEFIKMSYNYYKNSFQEASELNTSTHTFSGSYITIEGKKTLEITPYLQFHNWDGIYVSNRLGVSALKSQSLDSGEMGILGDLSKRSSMDDTYSYLDSLNLSGRGYVSWWNDLTLLELNMNLGYDGTQDIDYANGARLPLTHFFYGPGARLVHKFSEDFQLTTQATYLLRDYLNSAVPTKTRSDKELYYFLRTNYYFHPNSSVYFLYERLDNISTLGENDVRDKNYHVNTFSLGITWDYL